MPKSGGAGGRWQLSFRAHLFALLLAGVLPLTGLAFYSMLRLADAERSADESEITSTARVIAGAVDQQLRYTLASLRALAQQAPRRSDDMADFYDDCAALAAESGGWVLLADASGQQLFNTKRPLGAALPPIAATEEFHAAIVEGGPYVSNLLTASTDPQPQVTVFLPLFEGGTVARVLGMTFPTRVFSDLLRQQNLPADWTVAAVDRGGTILADGGAPPEADAKAMPPIVGAKASPEVASLAPDRDEGFFRLSNRRGVPVYMGVTRSALSGWKIVVGIPAATIDAPLHQTLARFAMLGLAVLLVALGATALIGAHLSATMKRLAATAHALGRREPMPPVRSTVREANQVAAALGEAETALDESERKLRRSRQHLLQAQHVAGLGSIEHNLRSGEIECSDEVFRIFGTEPFAPSLEKFLALMPTEDRAAVRDAAMAAEDGITPPPLEFRTIRPGGEIRTVRREAELICDDGGAASVLFVTLLDITELRAAEERQRQLEQKLLYAQQQEAARLRESEARLRRSQHHLTLAQRLARMGSVMHNFKSGVGEWSDEFYRILGRERGTMPATFEALIELIHPEDRARLIENHKALSQGGRPPAHEFRVFRPDGSVRTIQAEVEPQFDEAGEVDRLLVTCLDVTELRAGEARQRELERQLHHAQKLEALGTLAGGIAHDLNNTLVPVLGLTKITMRRLPEDSRERANLATILRAGERARDLVRQILAFSRKEAPTRERVDLGALIGDSLTMVRASLPATIEIEEAIAAVPPVLGDPGQLHQVVINLVVNAAQAIADKMGTISVTLSAERHCLPDESGAEAERQAIHLSVRDTGCGMDEATRQRIFEPFFTTKPVGEGTGLGLSVVHGIVAQHGGVVSVESRPGEGTRFDVYLPSVVDAAPGRREPAVAEA